jgi:hypothetical protein
MHQQLWGYKVEEKLHLGVREQKKTLNTAALEDLNPHIRRRQPLKSRQTKDPTSYSCQ